MPRSPAARTVRRSASTPRRWPSTRGRPRAAAQRPLPSMMMATCRGASKPSLPDRQRLGLRCLSIVRRRSNGHDLLFLGGKKLVDFGDGRVGRFLHLVRTCRSCSSSLILWSFSSFLRRSRPSRRTCRTATRAASVYLCATFTISRRRSSLSSGTPQPEDLSLGRRGQAEIGGGNRLLDRVDHRSVPDLDTKEPRLWNIDGSELIERHVAAIGLDLNMFEQSGRRTPGAQPAQLLLERGNGSLPCGA